MGKQRERGSMVRAGSALLLLLLLSNYVFFHLSIQGLPGKFIGGEEGSAEFQVRSNSKAKNKLICFDLIFVITVPFSRQQCPLNCPAGPKGPQGIQGVKVGNLFFYVTLKNSLCEVFVQLYRLSQKVFFVLSQARQFFQLQLGVASAPQHECKEAIAHSTLQGT